MNRFVAALPMYDWPQTRTETDAQWQALRDRLRDAGIDAPQALTRRNEPDGGLDLAALWRNPALLVSQTCWGPIEAGLEPYVDIIAQPDYSSYEGGAGELYSSAIVMRGEGHAAAPSDGSALLPLDLLRGGRLAFNDPDSMSGLLAISRDLEAAGEGLGIFHVRFRTGSHRDSAVAVAEGRADVAAIDCRTWDLVRRFEPEVAAHLSVVGWTSLRKGLPFIAARSMRETLPALLPAVRAWAASTRF